MDAGERGREERAAEEQKFRAAFERALDAIVIVEGEVFTDANPAACALIGLPRERIVGRGFREFHTQRDQATVDELFRKLLQDGAARGEIEVLRGDGTPRRVEFSVTANIQPGVHMSILRDVTERHRREIMSERYELLSKHARDIVLFIGHDGRILEANEAAARAYGYSQAELVTMNICDLRADGTREIVPAQIEEAFARGVLFETVHRRRDGSTFPVEVGSRAAMIGSEEVLLSIVRDLSERAELQANLIHGGRLATVGMLAAGVAHEINNPLAYAINSLDLLARRLPAVIRQIHDLGADLAGAPEALALGEIAGELAEAEQMLEIAREGAERVRAIARDVKRFARPDEGLIASVDVRDVLESSIGIAINAIRDRARLEREYGDAPPVAINESRLGQVLLNLLVNAAEAIPEGHAGANTIRVRTGTDDRGRAVIEIADTGAGIPPNLLARIFDPFVTTKGRGEGTGLGLYISRAIVKAAGGEITAESEVGRGTTVRIALPAARGGST